MRLKNFLASFGIVNELRITMLFFRSTNKLFINRHLITLLRAYDFTYITDLFMVTLLRISMRAGRACRFLQV